MAKNITTNTDTDFDGVNAGKVVGVIVTGTWGGTTITVQVKDGNGDWVAYPTDSSQTADFSRYYQVGEQAGLRLVSAGGSGADLWAQTVEYKP